MRVICHVDMDAFFAAVEQLDHPEYRNQPVVVGADPRQGVARGVVSAASYEARRLGIHSAQPIVQAYRLAPNAIYLKPRLSRYSEVSRQIMELLSEFSPLVEPISIDEAFLDLTGMSSLMGEPSEIGARIKERIKSEIGLASSVGIASSKFVAKIASDLNKPDGLTICPPGEETRFLDPLKIERLWGVGKKSATLLRGMGIETIGQLASYSTELLTLKLKNRAVDLQRLARGIDEREVSPGRERKSLSEERTFARDVSDDEMIERAILVMSEHLTRRIRKAALSPRTLTLKIRLACFETYTRSHSVSDSELNTMVAIRTLALELYRKFERHGRAVRLIGVGLSNFNSNEEPRQTELFDDASTSEQQSETTEKLLDEMQSRFGKNISRAALLQANDPTRQL